MLEVEKPWMESTSTYPLQKNMTFQVDTFVKGEDFGLRWETGAIVTEAGVEIMSDRVKNVVEII